MPDCFSEEFRSDVMSRIRSTGSKPEDRLVEIVRRVLGPKWRIDRNVRGLPGCPDVVVPSLRLCIFADGCFFHGCPSHWRPPATRREYWVPKIEGNIRRDKRHAKDL